LRRSFYSAEVRTIAAAGLPPRSKLADIGAAPTIAPIA
jgi:hypothetical protein